MGGLTLAGGITAALLARERGQQPPIVDVSLLGLGLWNLGFPVVAAKLYEGKTMPAHDPDNLPNPIARAYYQTADKRHLTLIMLESDRFWPDLCEHLDRPDLITIHGFTTPRRAGPTTATASPYCARSSPPALSTIGASGCAP